MAAKKDKDESRSSAATSSNVEAKKLDIRVIIGVLVVLALIIFGPVFLKGCEPGKRTPGTTQGNPQQEVRIVRKGTFTVNDHEWSEPLEFNGYDVRTEGDEDTYVQINGRYEFFIDAEQNIWKIENQDGAVVPKIGALFPRNAHVFRFKRKKGTGTGEITYTITPKKVVLEGDRDTQNK